MTDQICIPRGFSMSPAGINKSPTAEQSLIELFSLQFCEHRLRSLKIACLESLCKFREGFAEPLARVSMPKSACGMSADDPKQTSRNSVQLYQHRTATRADVASFPKT
jgi:hypothetical protein